jgi:glycosyltransferase involved in cell wall biosynthesis
MKILIAHNRYQQRGGEDVVFESETELLEKSGYEVRTLIVSNDAIVSRLDKLRATFGTVSNSKGAQTMSRAIATFQPDIVHVHNFFPLLSPSVYRVCQSAGVPVVQTLHNYRTICANAQLLRRGRICRLCVSGSPLWGAFHRCYRGSVVGSIALASMITVHRRWGTWSQQVDRFIALTAFSRSVFVDAGFPEDRIDVKPNFIADPGPARHDATRKGVLFVGRLSPEKGARTLVEACAAGTIPLRIIGDGPELSSLRQIASKNIPFLGQRGREEVLAEMRRAAAVVVPSLWYEGFPMAIVEAFACATPVIASNIGSLPEIVEDGATGLHAPAGDVAAWRQCLERAVFEHALMTKLGTRARDVYLERYTPQANLIHLQRIYFGAIEARNRAGGPATTTP